ncbi:MAG: C45 family autoproteolytic acyltransferase/hydrolase [Anaerolineae bacterium]
MMRAALIPVLTVRGTHREVGRQIGEAMRPRIRRRLERLREGIPRGISWEEVLHQSRLCQTYSRAVYPQYVEEIEGIAEGADCPFDEVFLAMCEELREPAFWRARGCTDFAARGRATVDGSTLLAHTNDESPDREEGLVILRVQAGDEPEFLGVSLDGLGISAGFNAAGIALTGNEVSARDVRPGVPRLLIVRAILAARRLGEAMDACLLPQRASNYNNIIADSWGEIYSVEGSATDYEALYIEGDILAHTNHYLSPAMRHLEADRNDIGGSILRYHRAMRLLRENFGALSPERFQLLLADHANYPASICKHGVETVTLFSIIIDVGRRRAWIGRGRPCETVWTEHQLESFPPPSPTSEHP